MSTRPQRPTRADIAGAVGRRLPDVIGPGLAVLFCGINPGLYSAAVGHHFARPGNRFWTALHQSGFTDRRFAAAADRLLLPLGYGLTNLVARATAAADELTVDELKAGKRRLARKVRRFRPRWLAVVGITAYRTAFNRPGAAPGRQTERIGETGIWVLPNPSGLNAHHQPAALAVAFRALWQAVGAAPLGEETGRG
jgi:double-stranded uracil-DNA glycosylase